MKLILVFAYKYDYELVPDLLKNVSGFIDGYVSYDDRKSKEIYSHEGNIRKILIKKAIEKGADWIIALDPDERLERGAGEKIRELIKTKEKIVYGFNFRELYQPDKYRTDGVWNSKIRYSLFPVFPNQHFMNLRVHSPWFPINDDYNFVNTGINLYHLKMINSQNRKDRCELYKKLDPKNEIQKIGYDYLSDESNLELETIENGREYLPPYNNDYNIRVKL